MSCEKGINIEQKVNFHFKSSLTINASVQKIEYFTRPYYLLASITAALMAISRDDDPVTRTMG